jgi:DNA-binding transcriptional ArsR family regulator
MPKAPARLSSLLQVVVTPRFEAFYALQALESGAGEHLSGWRREMERRLPARVRTGLAAVVPSPIMWPLLADALRDEPADITFPEMMTALRTMDEASFQRSVLAGVFKSPGSVDGLMSGRATLAATVNAEAESQQRLLSMLRLLPFRSRSGSAVAFERIVSSTASYRDEVVSVLESFWTAGFSDTWSALEPRLRSSAKKMNEQIAHDGFARFASERALPITTEGEEVITVRSGARTPAKDVKALCLIPSIFNTAKLWAAYLDSHKCTRFFIPVPDPALSVDSEPELSPELVFKALGDTTRYAIASMLARSPMTSVELARAFNVSKPTISHHVQLMRSAGLLRETPGEGGVVLSLNRGVLEQASSAAATEMFSGSGASQTINRSRRANKS